MAIEISTPAGKILVIRISGILTQPEFASSHDKAVEVIKKYGKVRFLILVENFSGFSKESDWNDVSFQFENDSFIEKMAIVGHEKWESVATVFTGKGIRPFPIQYFPTAELAKGTQWLST